MTIGIPKEICPGEMRVALIPSNVAVLVKKGQKVIVESGAGAASGYTDAEYETAGASIESNRKKLFKAAEVIIQVQAPGSNTKNGQKDLALLKKGHVVIGMMDPLANPDIALEYAKKGITALSLELMPRITRAQSMDVLSSMATISGYKAVLIAAEKSTRMFPMLMTAAGTVKPARVLIMGVGVAGLQACATAKRLGAVVEAYDVRPAAREQILSVGAKPVVLDLDTEAAEGKGGYAAKQSDEFLAKQRELMGNVLAQQDVVITTAAVPGAKSPILVTSEMVTKMKNGAIIVDLAAERGGNCDLTKLNEEVVESGVTILGPENVPSTTPFHASQMFGKNVENFLKLMLDEENKIALDFEDEIFQDTCISHDGDVPAERIRGILGLEKPAEAEASDTDQPETKTTETKETEKEEK